MKKNSSAVIIGASLSGLMAALSLASAGIYVIVLERNDETQRRGDSLSVHRNTFDTSSIAKKLRETVSGEIRDVESWRVVHKRLSEAVSKEPFIEVYYNIIATEVFQGKNKVYVHTNCGVEIQADLLIGADGIHSIVRKKVNPDLPKATFAGYLLWVALVEENEISASLCPKSSAPTFDIIDGADEDFLFAMIMPGMDDSQNVGKRQLGIAWYDNSFNQLLYDTGAVENNFVNYSLTDEKIPQTVYNTLLERSQKYFPEVWKTVTQVAIEQGYLVATPIAEYVPTKLVNGRMALVGDAAHALTPMTAKGFQSSLDDAAILGSLMNKYKRDTERLKKVLKEYEQERLKLVRQIVQSGQAFSRSFGR